MQNKHTMEINLPENLIAQRIFTIRGLRVMLDFHLAEMYGIPTKRLNQQVARNPERFPQDFMFQLTEEEYENLRLQNATSSLDEDDLDRADSPQHLRSQIATSSEQDFSGTKSWGGRRYMPYAFTEHGVMMLSSVLSSPLAVAMNIRIIRVYIKLRELLAKHHELADKIEQLEQKVDQHSEDISMVFQAIRELMGVKPSTPRKAIGFQHQAAADG